MARRKPPKVVLERIKQELRDSYGGKPGQEIDPLFAGFIVSVCPFCGTVLAMYNPATYRFSCLGCGRRGWRQMAAQLGIDVS